MVLTALVGTDRRYSFLIKQFWLRKHCPPHPPPNRTTHQLGQDELCSGNKLQTNRIELSGIQSIFLPVWKCCCSHMLQNDRWSSFCFYFKNLQQMKSLKVNFGKIWRINTVDMITGSCNGPELKAIRCKKWLLCAMMLLFFAFKTVFL